MAPESPILAVSAALHAACLRDLPVIVYLDRDWPRHREWLDAMTREERAQVYTDERASGQVQGPTIERRRRPSEQECLVTVFPQVWGSTALGYGGLGGAAMSTAYTVVVEAQVVARRAVYFGGSGRLAYVVPIGGANEEEFQKAIAERNLPSVRQAAALGWIPEEPVVMGGALELTAGQVAQLALFVAEKGEGRTGDEARYVLQHREDGHAGPGVYASGDASSEEGPVLLDSGR